MARYASQPSEHLPQIFLCRKFEDPIAYGNLETELNATGKYIFMRHHHPWNIGHGQICIIAFSICSLDVRIEQICRLYPFRWI